MKSHFTFTKQQRNGIFLLVLLIVIVQVSYVFIDLPSEAVSFNEDAYETYTKEIDSLRQAEIVLQQPRIFPFNPNYITDYKGATLGMSNEEIDRLLVFRKQDQWINSAKQFQEITKVSDSLLDAISPYFKFPDWVTNPKLSNIINESYGNKSKTYAQKLDLNIATVQQLQKVNGVGEVLSDRIVKFRNKFVGGFIADVQLEDVYGLSPEVIERITNHFTVKTPRRIEKINLKTATVAQLVTVQHIDYDLASEIIETRTLRDGFQSLDELKKVKDFPVNKLEIIKLYLSLEN
ncbi:ComEA family DNA-binding protein [Aestuariivivens sp. NBU2969]|uniref:ComEA family DNA-binding protein n=1 Tax=Aestuariivivens sp. NBU2969 TaxID=2873267 RepID=UPI001CBED5E0|nr:helix-hairpin-helix domain-containing protein [Aestuariivivens sp. NBU2969]